MHCGARRILNMSCRFIDIAVNLTDSMFQGVYHGKQRHVADLDLVLERAYALGVDKIIATGTTSAGT